MDIAHRMSVITISTARGPRIVTDSH